MGQSNGRPTRTRPMFLCTNSIGKIRRTVRVCVCLELDLRVCQLVWVVFEFAKWVTATDTQVNVSYETSGLFDRERNYYIGHDYYGCAQTELYSGPWMWSKASVVRQRLASKSVPVSLGRSPEESWLWHCILADDWGTCALAKSELAGEMMCSLIWSRARQFGRSWQLEQARRQSLLAPRS